MDREIQQIQYINDLKRFNYYNISYGKKDSTHLIYQNDEKIHNT